MIVRRRLNPMRVRAVLAFLIGAELALIADIRSGGTELALGAERKYDDVPRGVVGDEHIFSGAIKADVAGIFAKGRHLIEQRKLPTFLINRKSANAADFTVFVRGVRKRSARMQPHPAPPPGPRREDLRAH